MHKVRASAAREQVLHDDFNTNPFAKKRKPSIYPEPDEDEGQKPPDPENFVAELVRRGTRKLSFAKRENVNNRTNKRNFKKPGSGQSSAQLQSIDEEKPAHLYEEPASDVQESRAITWRHKAFLTWRQWRIYIAKIGLGNQWRIKPAIAGITRSTIAVAPLSATGHYFLPAAPRPSQAVVIEYQNGQLGPNRAPVFRFSGQTEHSHVSGKEFSGLKDLTDETQVSLNSIGLRVMSAAPLTKSATYADRKSSYVQDDDRVSHQLISDFHINTPAFSRSRAEFRDWVHGAESDHLSVWQTALWKPSYDRSGNLVRAAFGLHYLVPQIQSVSVMENQSRLSRKSTFKATIENSNADVHKNALQRVSVYIQLPRDPMTPMGSTGPSTDVDDIVSRSSAHQGKKKAGRPKVACERTVVILDSRLKAIATEPLIAGDEPWQQLLDSLDDPSSQSGCLALAVVGLVFEAVEARWVHYILCMHGYIASLEERVYEDPADDSRTGALWSVSKQLLQAERLLKFHILLLENIQNDFGELSQEDSLPPDWLRPSLDEFRRLSSEVEETLKKPTAHMVDLMYKSISIRDARQSLQLNTSLWRISWLTFIFLPLTFLTSFFGMNVAELQKNPGMKWYFIVATPLMCITLLSWLLVKSKVPNPR